jgi:PAS domain S-box-containing protein
MTDMIVVGTPDGRIIYSNKAMSQKLGYSEEELHSMHVLDINPIDKRQEAEAIFDAMFRGERDSCPLPLAAKDGSLIPAETRVWFGQWHGEDCIFGICKDLSTEQEAQQRFERLFHNNPLPLALSTLPDRCFYDVNDAFLNTTGYSRSEITGKTAEELELFPQIEKHKSSADNLESVGRLIDTELQIRRKDGILLTGLFSGDVISSQGKHYFLTVMVDITERKQVEEALRESERKYRALFNAESDGIFVVDKETGVIVDCNDAITTMYGYRRDELIGQLNTTVSAEPDSTRAATAEPQHIIPIRYHLKKGGTVFPVEMMTDVVSMQNREMIVVAVRDITDRIRTEEVLAREAKRDQHIAKVLQQTLLPSRMPKQPAGYEIATIYQPALTEAEVCGDFYDLFDLGDGKMGVLIGDITGKGVQAASRVAAVRYTVRSYAFTDESPSSVMTLVNKALFRDIMTESDMFTAFFAVLDTRNGTFTYTKAGHEPPLLKHLDGTIEYLITGGPMLTGMGEFTYQEGKLDLRDGDILVLYTDGVTDARKANSPVIFGADGILQSLSGFADTSAEEIASSILKESLLFVGGSLRDDAAIVVIKKTK